MQGAGGPTRECTRSVSEKGRSAVPAAPQGARVGPAFPCRIDKQKQERGRSSRLPTPLLLWGLGCAESRYPCISSSSLPLVSCTNFRMKTIETMAQAV